TNVSKVFCPACVHLGRDVQVSLCHPRRSGVYRSQYDCLYRIIMYEPVSPDSPGCCTDDSVHEELHGYWLSSDRFAVFPDCHANGRESLLSSQLVPLAEEYRIYDRNIVPAGGQVAVDREPVLTESIDSVSSYHHEAVCGFAQNP